MSIRCDYSNQKFLEKEFLSRWGELAKEHPGASKGKGIGTYKAEAVRCSKLYVNAMSNYRSFIVLGETAIRQDKELMINLGVISTSMSVDGISKKSIKNLLIQCFPHLKQDPKKLEQESNSHLSKGGVLNEGNWFILPNDIVMLGVIHSSKECHIATKDGAIPDKDTLWDEEDSRPRVLGRELLQLYHSGYRVVSESLKGKGIIMMQVDGSKTKQQNLWDIRECVKNKTLAAIDQVFSDTVPYADTVRGKMEAEERQDKIR